MPSKPSKLSVGGGPGILGSPCRRRRERRSSACPPVEFPQGVAGQRNLGQSVPNFGRILPGTVMPARRLDALLGWGLVSRGLVCGRRLRPCGLAGDGHQGGRGRGDSKGSLVAVEGGVWAGTDRLGGTQDGGSFDMRVCRPTISRSRKRRAVIRPTTVARPPNPRPPLQRRNVKQAFPTRQSFVRVYGSQ